LAERTRPVIEAVPRDGTRGRAEVQIEWSRVVSRGRGIAPV